MRQFLEAPRALRWLVAVVVGAGAIVLARVLTRMPEDIDLVHLMFWTILTLVSSALPVRLPGGVTAHTTTAPIIASLFDSMLPQPFAVCVVALVGTVEMRDLRRELVWYGTLYNRFAYLLSGFAAWLAVSATAGLVGTFRDEPVISVVSVVVQLTAAGAAFSGVNLSLAVLAASLRTATPISRVWAISIRNVATGFLALVPLGWLMAEIAVRVGLWAALLFIVPLQLARYAFSKYTETRELFLGSVSALSQAIDAKDGFTRGHADRVSRIAGAIAREMGLNEQVIERIELAALLHDIGKIGVDDRILMKPARLDDEERDLMRRHPQYGASILEPSAALRPLVPIVLHHHENYDGSGYPDGLKGEAIPLGSRILIVADAYEAMTSDRIYRKAIGHDRAMEQLNKYKGIQFDPKVVRALETLLRRPGAGAFEVSDLPPINYETLAQLRERLAHRPATRDAHAG